VPNNTWEILQNKALAFQVVSKLTSGGKVVVILAKQSKIPQSLIFLQLWCVSLRDNTVAQKASTVP
jgi:hypothetical protein